METSLLAWIPALLVVGCLGAATEKSDGAAGSSGMAASGSSGVSGTDGGGHGGSSMAGTGGTIEEGEGGGVDGGGAAGAAGVAGDANGGQAGAPPVTDPLSVIPSAGCGTAPAQVLGEFVQYTMTVSGTKDPDSTDTNIDGPWTMDREYFVRLPNGYDSTKAYPLVLQGPGCTGTGQDVYTLAAVADDIIKVGLTPPEATSIGHIEAPGAGCFDDKEGDDSVEWPFYEAVIDKLRAELCFDENRIFAAGSSSGAWLANELACKYAGNTEGYAIRAIAANEGGLPTDPTRVPACTDDPFAGLWIFKMLDAGGPFSGNKVAIARAMQVNGCTLGTSWDDATRENYPIGGGQADETCQRILGCPEEYPLVVCELPSAVGYSSNEAVFSPAFTTFLQMLAAP
ncbi:MAG TPA: hypothetical protein VM686_43015 [Polyangiaceae bacterium]|nr:hypothetical protein [Polyangiaceae bacterium]